MVLRWRSVLRLGLISALFLTTLSAVAAARSPADQAIVTRTQRQPVLPIVSPSLPRTRAAPAQTADVYDVNLDRAQRLLGEARVWLAQSYKHSPEAVAGLTILAILPLLALPACLFWLGSALRARFFQSTAINSAAGDQIADVPPGLSTAWLEVALTPGSATRLPLDRPMLRIGRHDENDICLPDASVHGYHALIYWSPEEAFQIHDLTAAEETGVLVNGQPIGATPLRQGDLIELGNVRMLFATVHA